MTVQEQLLIVIGEQTLQNRELSIQLAEARKKLAELQPKAKPELKEVIAP